MINPLVISVSSPPSNNETKTPRKSDFPVPAPRSGRGTPWWSTTGYLRLDDALPQGYQATELGVALPVVPVGWLG